MDLDDETNLSSRRPIGLWPGGRLWEADDREHLDMLKDGRRRREPRTRLATAAGLDHAALALQAAASGAEYEGSL